MAKREPCENIACFLNEEDLRGKTNCKRTKYLRTVENCTAKQVYDNMVADSKRTSQGA